jgi:hypothetical protein
LSAAMTEGDDHGNGKDDDKDLRRAHEEISHAVRADNKPGRRPARPLRRCRPI